MSWQEFLESRLPTQNNGGQLTNAAIMGLEGVSLWAFSPGFRIDPGEIPAIVEGFNDSSQLQQASEAKVSIAGWCPCGIPGADTVQSS
jgi:hypothetical protein